MSDLTAARDALDELTLGVNWLAASLIPGTGKPYRAPTMSIEARAERDRQARLERLERVGIAPGETRAVLDLGVADLLSEIMATADELADKIAHAAGLTPMPPAPSAFADPVPYLRFTATHLPAATSNDPDLPADIEGRCDALVYRVHTELGLLGDGQVLDVTCPWCDGRTATHPVGGAKTWRVRAQLPAGKKSLVTRDPATGKVTPLDPDAVRWYVVCESGTCAPSSEDCGERVRGRPAWLLRTEGHWLAQRVEAAAAS